MAKEKQESDLEITNESKNPIEVNTEKAEEYYQKSLEIANSLS